MIEFSLVLLQTIPAVEGILYTRSGIIGAKKADWLGSAVVKVPKDLS